MGIKNIKGLLTQATALPTAIEAKLPAGSPKISKMLLDAANQAPNVPDFPVELPDLPAPPEIPELPAPPGGLGRFVYGVEVRPVPTAAERLNARAQRETIPSPHVGVLPEVISRRGM